MKIKGIVCSGPEGVIGTSGFIMPWHVSADLRFFKAQTFGYPCVFGRNTYFNLPVRPLPGRLNCVLSRNFKKNGTENAGHLEFNSIQGLLSCPVLKQYDVLWVCGGAKLYKDFICYNLIDEMYVTHIFSPTLADCIKKEPDKFIRLSPCVTDVFNSKNWEIKNLDTQTEREFFLKFNVYTKKTDSFHQKCI